MNILMNIDKKACDVNTSNNGNIFIYRRLTRLRNILK